MHTHPHLHRYTCYAHACKGECSWFSNVACTQAWAIGNDTAWNNKQAGTHAGSKRHCLVEQKSYGHCLQHKQRNDMSGYLAAVYLLLCNSCMLLQYT